MVRASDSEARGRVSLLTRVTVVSWSKTNLLPKSSGNTQEAVAPSQHDCKIEIESLVPRDKMFKDFQNIWAWKPSGHVTNIFITSYLKVYIQNFVKESQVVSSLSSEIRPLRQICQGQSMGIIYTHYDGLDVDASYKVSCKPVKWFWRIF